jgi:hypothetical protein
MGFSVKDGILCLIVGSSLMMVIGFALEVCSPTTCRKRPKSCGQSKGTVENINSDESSSWETKYMNPENYEPVPPTLS